ncbi:ABC transporter permease [Tatumella sp. TA1]|nr:ABC transporter permease [Tatumella sp. TA1]
MISFCIISALVAVIAPLLLLFGLRFGIVSQLEQQLISDPRNLEIRMLSSGNYSQAWIDHLKQRSEVGFAIGQTRSLNTLADLQKDPRHFIENAEVIPTASGDPLLGNIHLIKDDDVVLTENAARQLSVKSGDSITLRVSRSLEGRLEMGQRRVHIVGVLAPTYFNRSALFTRQDLLVMLENFRDGYLTPSLGAQDGTSLAQHIQHFARVRLYAKDIDQVAGLEQVLNQQRIETSSRLADIENVKSINRVLGVIFNIIAATALLGSIASLVGSFIANIDRKRKHIAVLRLLGFTRSGVAIYVILQGLILSLAAYLGGYSLYLFSSSVFNHVLSTSQITGQMLCRLTPIHALIAMGLTVVISLVVATIAAYRATIIEPAQSLREL